MIRSLVGLLCAGVLVGCSDASLRGQVGGESVGGARSALFDEFSVDVPLIGAIGYALVVVTDIPDACDALTDLFSAGAGSCQSTCDGLSASAQDYLGGDSYYLTAFSMNIGDNPVREYDFATVPASPGDFVATYTTIDVSGLYDADACVETCESTGDIAPQRVYNADDGEVEVSKYEAGSQLKGRFELDLAEGGELDGSFDAKPCALSSVLGL